MPKIENRTQFAKTFGPVYAWLLSNNKKLLDQILPRQRQKLTRESVIKTAKGFDTKSEWAKAEGGSYRFAKKMGFFEECVAHMDDPYKTWTKTELIKDAKKYSSRAEWDRLSPTAVKYARRTCVFEECVLHMKVLRRRWTVESAIMEAKKYGSRGEWAKRSPGSYEYALRNGITNALTKNRKQRVSS